MVAVLSSFIYQLISHTTFIGKLWYLNMLIFRLLIIVTVGCGIYADEERNFSCARFEDFYWAECYDNYASTHKNPNIIWTFQILFSFIPVVFFHFYLSDVDNKILRISTLKHDIKEIYEADELPLNAAARVRNKKLLLKHLKSHVGDYKYRLVLQGGRPVEVVHSKRILLANLTHLTFRFTVEVLTIVYITLMYQQHQRERIEKEGITNGFFNVTQETMFWCETSHEMVAKHDRCYIPRSHEKSQFLTYMNVMAFIAALLTISETLYMIVKNRNRYRRHRIQTRYENSMRRMTNLEQRTHQEENLSLNNITTSSRPEQAPNTGGRGDRTGTSHPDVRQPQRTSCNYVEARISQISRDERESQATASAPPRYSTLNLNQ